MSWKKLAGKGTWLGVAAALAVLLAGLGLSALLLLRGAVPEGAMRPLVWFVSGAACFCGGRVAVRKGAAPPLPQALAVSACVYALLWLAVLAGETEPQFAAGGLTQTCAVWLGGLLAGVLGTKRRKKKSPYPRRKGTERRKRSVT